MMELILRGARLDDGQMLWAWRNAYDARSTAFNSELIPLTQHEVWFAQKLADPEVRILIAELGNGLPVGQIRFEIGDTEAEVDVLVDEHMRGAGYGSEIIRQGTEILFNSNPIDAIVAYIKEGNVGSMRAFEKAGFRHVGRRTIGEYVAIKMFRERSDLTSYQAGDHGNLGD